MPHYDEEGETVFTVWLAQLLLFNTAAQPDQVSQQSWAVSVKPCEETFKVSIASSNFSALRIRSYALSELKFCSE